MSGMRGLGARDSLGEPRIASTRDAEDYVAHLARHLAESGNGDIVFAPFEPPVRWSTEGKARQIATRWAKGLDEVGWERSWVLSDSGKIVAHLDIGCDPKTIAANLHRAYLSMGIERGYRGLGLGRGLVRTGLEWARAQPSLKWLELEVFGHNKAAIALYRSEGFQQCGVTIDRFRVAGQSIDDIHMVLKL